MIEVVSVDNMFCVVEWEMLILVGVRLDVVSVIPTIAGG